MLGRELRALTTVQRNTFTACFLSWSLDAFDFFLLTFCLSAIAGEFHVGVKTVAEAIFWTLVMRPVGALLFGLMAERFGRRAYVDGERGWRSRSLSWRLRLHRTLPVFLVVPGAVRDCDGWGLGGSVRRLRSRPCRRRVEGSFPGCCRRGYVIGNLLAAAAYGLLFSHLHGTGVFTGWPRAVYDRRAAGSAGVFICR